MRQFLFAIVWIVPTIGCLPCALGQTERVPVPIVIAPDQVPLLRSEPATAEPALIESDSEQASGAGSLSTAAPDGPSALADEPSLEAEISSFDDGTTPLTLADVIASLYRSYPMVQAARQEPQLAVGLLVESNGAYDTKLKGYSLSEPTGFYRNHRTAIGLARQTWWGGSVSTGYRIGRGEFQPWYKERETNEGGEFRLGATQPLLQGRAIDPQRVAVFQASLERQAAEPRIQQSILDASRDAALQYWGWVAAGGVLEAQRELLELAETRGEQYAAGVKAGKFAEIDLILNQQLIAERRAKVLAAELKYRQTAFKLSLFLRDDGGQPLVPDDVWLPDQFPVIQPPPLRDFAEDVAAALVQRPEPRVLRIEIQQLSLERRLACNNMLPRLDMIAEASQDTGKPTSSLRDKSRFELLVGVQGEVPIQRRKARGKLQSTTAKIAQLNQKLRLQQDKITTELRMARNSLELSAAVVEQAELSLRAAIETLDRYRFAFERGKIDLVYLVLLESNANETEIRLVEAQQTWFAALAELQAALGLDPLDQAMVVAALPDSNRPGPGRLPEPGELETDAFNQDWQRHIAPADAP